MGRGEHLAIVQDCIRRLGSRGGENAVYWKAIGACTRCGSTRFWRTPGGVLCKVCYPPPGVRVKSWGFKPRRPVIQDE